MKILIYQGCRAFLFLLDRSLHVGLLVLGSPLVKGLSQDIHLKPCHLLCWGSLWSERAFYLSEGGTEDIFTAFGHTCNLYVAHGPPVLPHTTQFFHNSFSGDIRIFLNHIIFVLLAIRTIYPIVVGVGRVWRRTSTNSLKAPTLFNTNSLTNI